MVSYSPTHILVIVFLGFFVFFGDDPKILTRLFYGRLWVLPLIKFALLIDYVQHCRSKRDLDLNHVRYDRCDVFSFPFVFAVSFCLIFLYRFSDITGPDRI